MKKMIYICIVIVIVIGGYYLLHTKKVTPEKLYTKSYMDPKNYELSSHGIPQKVMDHDSALAYIMAWKQDQGIRDDDSSYILIDSPSHIRADVGSLEFEYTEGVHILIARALLNKRISGYNPDVSRLIVEKLTTAIDHTYGDVRVELDTSAGELNAKFPQRLNLRLDISDASTSASQMVTLLDNLSNLEYYVEKTTLQTAMVEARQEAYKKTN